VAGSIRVGTSSWADPGFVQEWYPPGLSARERLPWYARHFGAVEVNSTFYAVPDPETVRGWVAATPPDFSFDVKLHRLLSRHAAGPDSLPPALRDEVSVTQRGRVRLDSRLERQLVARTLAGVAPLAESRRLGCLLLQLSPAFAPREHELDELADLIAGFAPHPVAVELRHRAWVSPARVTATLEWMSDHEAVWVGVDAPRGDQVTIMPPLDAVTRPGFAYLRAHGRTRRGCGRGRTVPERFGWNYAEAELQEIADRARSLAETVGDGGQVRLMFNNNRGRDAPVAAERMRELLGQTAVSGL
jgi:uncharacterized protein YecE (DUF72 family)